MTLLLDDLRALREPDKIANLYHLLGYRADLEPQGYSAEEAQLEGAAANSVNQVYLLTDMDGLQHMHLETTDLSTPALRRVAENVLKRPGRYLLSFADPEYTRVIFVKPSKSEGAVRISKLALEPHRPTRHDLHTLEAMRWLPHLSGEALHLRQIEAFNVERVTQEFFEVYKTLFGHFRRTLVEQNPFAQIGALRKQTTADLEAVHAFTQRLLGRIIFLYFIQKKGWLNGQSDFLKKTYAETLKLEGANFYRDALEPLFFETLNTQRPGNRSQFGNIPYLNGSLFEREYPDSTVLNLPNSLFDPALEDSVLGVFEHYSFTVEESSSLESDVSLDPEMLGKVFENLMEKGEAAASGTFYTPRSIVQFLSEESLSRYLSDKTGIALERVRPLLDEGDDPGDLEREEARSIKRALESVRVLDPAVGTASMLVGMLSALIRVRRSVEARLGTTVETGSATLADWKKEYIVACLYGVDIKAEAIEIGRLRLWLSLVVDATEPEPLPNLDYKLMAGDGLLETIDGTPFIKPQEGLLGGVGEIAERSRAIETLHSRFYREENPQRRRELRDEISALERELFKSDIEHRIAGIDAEIKSLRGQLHSASDKKKAQLVKRDGELSAHLGRLLEQKQKVWDEKEPLPFFLHGIHFAEVVRANGGFDIIIGNPPYVRHELLPKSYKAALEVAFPEVYVGTGDLYLYFFQKALSLLRPGGRLAFITPNKFLKAGYGEKLRGVLSKDTTLEMLVDFGNLKVFDATTSPFITLAKKAKPNGQALEMLPERTLKAFAPLSAALSVPKDKLLAVRTVLSTFHVYAHSLMAPLEQRELTADGWVLDDPRVLRLLEKLRGKGVKLGEFVEGKFYRGIVTGYNDAFVIDDAKRLELIAADPRSAEIIKPFLRGKDVRRWKISYKNLYLIFARRGIKIEEYPAIKAHLEVFQDGLEPKPRGWTPQKKGEKWPGRKEGTYKWYEIQDDIAYYLEFDKRKIVYPVMSFLPNFDLDESGSYSNDKTFIIPIGKKDSWLLSLLNSSLVRLIVSAEFTRVVV